MPLGTNDHVSIESSSVVWVIIIMGFILTQDLELKKRVYIREYCAKKEIGSLTN